MRPSSAHCHSITPRYTSRTAALRHHLARIALGDLAAEAHRHDPAHHRDQGVDDVLDPHDRDAAVVQLADLVDQLARPPPRSGRRRSRRAAAPTAASPTPAPTPVACGRAGRATPRSALALASMPVRSSASTATSVASRLASREPYVDATSTFSNTVSPSNGRGIWAVRANPAWQRRCGGCRVTSTPSIRIRPASGVRSPAIRLSSVVLPAPLGPTMPTASPSRDGEAEVLDHRACRTTC